MNGPHCGTVQKQSEVTSNISPSLWNRNKEINMGLRATLLLPQDWGVFSSEAFVLAKCWEKKTPAMFLEGLHINLWRFLNCFPNSCNYSQVQSIQGLCNRNKQKAEKRGLTLQPTVYNSLTKGDGTLKQVWSISKSTPGGLQNKECCWGKRRNQNRLKKGGMNIPTRESKRYKRKF